MFTAEQVQSLNELEREVYEFVMHNQSRVQYMRIRELAAGGPCVYLHGAKVL